jgi:hypothetical protein
MELSGSMWDKFVYTVSDIFSFGDDEVHLSYLDVVLDARNAAMKKARNTIYKDK